MWDRSRPPLTPSTACTPIDTRQLFSQYNILLIIHVLLLLSILLLLSVHRGVGVVALCWCWWWY
jgi:hypothetical protein